ITMYLKSVRTVLWVAIGWIVGISLGMLCCIYVATLHENDLWFSNIKEVEREISFRTECGLYYSYYKQMLRAPSIQQGLSELISDNATESKRTINLLRRMNIYQEVFLGVLYRILPIQAYLEPVYFYIYTVFSLQAVYVIALFITSWLLSGSWLAGALTGVWYILNRVDTTRVEFTISLRENWSLPFFALQIAAITCYLRPHLKPIQQKVVLWLMFLATLCFCLTWQFNQFILLVQALIIFTLDCLDLISTEQVTCLYLVQVSSLLSVWLLQFCNSMILGSLALSFIVSALFVKHFQTCITWPYLFSLCIFMFVQQALQLRSDEHIFKFIKSKFGLGPTRDFDASLYLCEEAFGLLPLDTFDRLAGTLLAYPYLVTLIVLLVMLALLTLDNLCDSSAVGRPLKGRFEERPICMRADVAYNLLHTVFFGLLALSTMRMKYLWTGHMCAFAAYGVCGKELWSLCLNMIHCNTKTKVKTTAQILKVSFNRRMKNTSSTLSSSSKTPKTAVFAGSMQLLAGIKLCTGRVLTNHPHYEDRALRERTRQVYQIYAQQSPEEVHRILRAAGADFVVMEDSVCYERRHGRGCRLRDLLDLANGHIMDGPGDNDPDLVHASHPRFCASVKTDGPAYTALFTRVFQNKTFHVYNDHVRLTRR
uniref:Dpy-19 like C-mannosyltransferase 3 n=1 Tax=Salmo trutta TaxID=8032 RepID=A0A673WN58_SALTR